MNISIVLCTYNGARFLSEQLESLLAQTLPPSQIVIQDDGSKDETWQQLQAFATRATKAGISVTLLRNPLNLGYVKNFETALQHANGELIFLCDQDDVWYQEKLAAYHSEFERRPELGLLHSDATLIDAEGHNIGHQLLEVLEVSPDEFAHIHDGLAFDVLLRRNIVTGATLACRQNVIQAALPIAPSWIHDEWIAMIAAVVSQVDCIERPLIGYRQHDANQIGARRLTWSDKLKGTGIPRREFMRSMAVRMENLLERIHTAQLPLSAERLVRLQERIRHGYCRAEMPATFSGRLPHILNELKQGAYWRYSSGLRSVISDILGLQ